MLAIWTYNWHMKFIPVSIIGLEIIHNTHKFMLKFVEKMSKTHAFTWICILFTLYKLILRPESQAYKQDNICKLNVIAVPIVYNIHVCTHL